MEVNTKYIGKKILHLDVVDSTNNELRRHLKTADEGFTVIANTQTNGKGRLGRTWLSSDNEAIYMSILVKPYLTIDSISQITLLCGLAVCKALNKATGINTKIKWPNDIVVDNKKICGILCEGIFNGSDICNVIVGIGINVQNKQFPKEIQNKAASIYTITSKKYYKSYIIPFVLEEFERLYDNYKNFGLSFLKEYKENCITLNRNISFYKDGKNINGYAFDVDEMGNLKAYDETKTVYTIDSCEVTVQGIY